MKLKALPANKIKYDYIPFAGGSDYESPPIEIPPGFVSSSINVEQNINGGYQTLTGYERFDGRPSPSAQLALSLPYSVLGTVMEGDDITGATSGATAHVLAVTATRLIVTKIVGVFVAESVGSGCTITGGQSGVSGSALEKATYKSKAADYWRTFIQAVPGEGPVLGVWYYNETVYAFRNAIGTNVGMYKSSPAGWVSVPLGFSISYTAGSGTQPAIGATIAKSGVTAVIKAITLESGSFGSGTAAGRIIVASVSGGNFSAGAFTSGITATCSGIQTAITIPGRSGKYEFINTTFTNSVSDTKMYGADGKNNAFEFDGETYVPIVTPLDAVLFPVHIIEHQKQLFLSYGSSFVNSNIGYPYGWTTTGGTAEIATGELVTGFLEVPGSETNPAMLVFCRNSTHVLYGTSSADFSFIGFNKEQGAIPYTTQTVHKPLCFDDRGVTEVSQAQEFGNFIQSTLTQRVKTFLSGKRNKKCDSHVSRDKDQYRLFFDDGTGAYFQMSSNTFSMMPVRFPNPVLCSVSLEKTGGGEELIFFGSDNGFVYQMERGTSFDGEAIDANFTLVFNHSKAYWLLKKYRLLIIESKCDGFHQFSIGMDLSYKSNESIQPQSRQQTISTETVQWDNFVWDNFTWDGNPALSPLRIPLEGDGHNIALKFASNGKIYSPIKLSGGFMGYETLRMLK